MAKPVVDISMIGDKELEQMLKKLPDIAQRKVVAAAARKSSKRSISLVVQAVSGNPVGVDTGRLLTGMALAKPQKQPSKEAVVYYMFLPSRDQLNIAYDDLFFYPLHVEYGYIDRNGHAVSAKSYLRSTIDDNKKMLVSQMGMDIRKGIIRNMKRLAKKKL